MRTSAVLGIIMLVVYGVGTVHGRKYIKQLNIRLNIDTLAMLIEENNDVLTIGGGLLSPNQLINLNSAASSVGFRDLSFNVYEEDGREYVEMEGILQLLIPLMGLKK